MNVINVKTKDMIAIRKGMCRTTYYDFQYEMAEDLGIKNSSKKAIEARCRVLGWTADFEH